VYNKGPDAIAFNLVNNTVHTCETPVNSLTIEDASKNPHTLKIPILINNVQIEALGDTGASLSILDASLVNTKNLIRCENILMRGASGRMIPLKGLIEQQILIGKTTFQHKFAVVENFPFKALLGLDFLRANGAIINCAQKTITFLPTNISSSPLPSDSPFHAQTAAAECAPPVNFTDEPVAPVAHFALSQPAEIQPLSKGPIPIKLSGNLVKGEYFAFPNRRLLHKHHIYAPAFTFHSNEILEEMLLKNISRFPQKLYKDQVIYKIFKLDDFPEVEILPLCSMEIVNKEKTQDNDETQPKEENPLDLITINPDLTSSQKKQIRALLEKYKIIFPSTKEELPTTDKIQHIIRFHGPPVNIKPYREAAAQREEMRTEINRLLARNIIEPSSSPFSSPAFIIKKKDGGLRLVCNFQAINNQSEPQVYYLPLIADILASFHNVKYMASLDCNSAFFQIPLEESSRDYSSFSCSAGKYRFKVAPFGLQGCPATFQNLTDSIFSDIKWEKIINYIDDFYVKGNTFTQFLENLEDVFKRVEDAKLRFKPSKCFLGFQKLDILGWNVSTEGIAPDPKKVSALTKLKEPKNYKELLRALGMFSYYRRQLPNMAKIAAPLYALTKADTPYIWGPAQADAFAQLILAISSPPILAHYNPKAETFLEVDSSKIAMGAVLAQIDDNGVKRPICFASRATTPAEKNLASAALECTGLAWAILHFKFYLYGLDFKVLSDSHAICSITRLKDPYGRIARLLLRLQPYKFKMIHISGKKHVCPDFLSRQEADWDPFDEVAFYEELEIPACFAELVDIIKSQSEDEKLIPIIEAIKTNCESRESKNYVLLKNVLYKKGASARGNMNLLVIPEGLKKTLMYTFHEDPVNGAHLSFAKCFDKIKLRFYWQGMLNDIKMYIRSCPICQAHNKSTQQKFGSLQPVARPNIPFIKITLDFAGPFPRATRTGNTMLLIAVDYHSGWVELKAMRAATAENTVKFLRDTFVYRTGMFLEMVCDRGSQFTSSLTQEFLKLISSKMIRISTFHPMANGKAERMVKTVKSIIAKYCTPNQKNWDEQLGAIQFAINTSPHKSLNESPYAIVYNRQPILPGEILGGQEFDEELIINIQNRLALAEEIRAEFYHKQQAYDKERFDAAHRLMSFEPGELVSIYTPKPVAKTSKKLNPCFFGPREIVSKVSDITYMVRTGVGANVKIEPINIRRLKPYFTRV